MKMYRFLTLIFVGLFMMTLLPVEANAQDPKEILRKWEDKFRGNTSLMELKMTIVRPEWTREISLKAWAKGHDYSMILIQAPARDKGTVFLKRQNEIWNWIPSIERSVKMPPSMMMQSWMGSDFTNDDLVRESSTIEDYTHKILGEETIDGRVCYKIEMKPKPGAPVVWGKILTWISKSETLTMKTQFFDEDNVLVNTMLFSKIQTMGGRVIPTKMEMIPAEKPGNKTIMEYQSLQYNITIDDGFFSLANMQRVN